MFFQDFKGAFRGEGGAAVLNIRCSGGGRPGQLHLLCGEPYREAQRERYTAEERYITLLPSLPHILLRQDQRSASNVPSFHQVRTDTSPGTVNLFELQRKCDNHKQPARYCSLKKQQQKVWFKFVILTILTDIQNHQHHHYYQLYLCSTKQTG